MQSIRTVLFGASEKYFKRNPFLARKLWMVRPQKSRFLHLRTKEFEGSQLGGCWLQDSNSLAFCCSNASVSLGRNTQHHLQVGECMKTHTLCSRGAEPQWQHCRQGAQGHAGSVPCHTSPAAQAHSPGHPPTAAPVSSPLKCRISTKMWPF